MEPVEMKGAHQSVVGTPMVYDALAQRYDYRVAFVRPRYFWYEVVLILLIGLVLRVWNLGGASLWSDEALTALRAQARITQSLDSLFSAGNQAPLYFLSLQFLPSYSEAMLRMPSVLMGLIGIVFIMFVAVRLYGNYDVALWAGALLAVNPYHVLLSRTARPYALMFVLALAASYLFLLLMRQPRSRVLWGSFVLTNVIGYLTHYTFLALAAAQFMVLALLMPRRWTLYRRWAVAHAVSGIPTLIWVLLVAHHGVEVGPGRFPTPQLKDIALTLWSMTLGYTGLPKWFLVPGLMVVAYALVFAMWSALRDGRYERENFYWVWLIVLTVSGTFLISFYTVSFYMDRYFMVFLPALIFLLPQGWQGYPRRLMHVAMAVVMLTGAYNILVTFRSGDFQRQAWRGAAVYVAREWQPGDAILLERDTWRVAFTHYFEMDSPAASQIVLLSDAPDYLRTDMPAGRVWVVYRNPIEDSHRQGVMPEFNPFQKGRAPMGDWLHERPNQVIQQRYFNGVRVLLLDPRLGRVRQGP